MTDANKIKPYFHSLNGDIEEDKVSLASFFFFFSQFYTISYKSFSIVLLVGLTINLKVIIFVVQKILRPVEYILQRLGKEHAFRRLPLAFNYWFKISIDKLEEINEIIDIAYTICFL